MLKEGVEDVALRIAQRGIDGGVQGLVNFLSEGAEQAIEGTEGRELHMLIDQRFDRRADQVGRIAHGLCCTVDCVDDDGAASLREGTAAQPTPNGIAVPMHRGWLLDLIDQWGLLGDAELFGEIPANLLGDLGEGDEVTQPLPGFEEDRQRQLARVATRVVTNELLFLVAQAVVGLQLLVAKPGSETGIGGSVDRSHGDAGDGVRKRVYRDR